MLKGQNISRRIKIGKHASVLKLDDILLLFERNQHKIKQENNTDKNFEFGIVNKTRYHEKTTYTLNLGWICCEAELTDYWFEHINGEHYFCEQTSKVKWNRKNGQNTSGLFSSYDDGPLLRYGRNKTNPHVRLAVNKIMEMCK